MAHFAKLDKNNIVLNVLVVNDEVITDEDGNEQEQLGIEFLSGIFSGGHWKQTSYNTHGGVHDLGGTPFRKNYAGKGFIYDPNRDAFYEPQPYDSWTFNGDTCHWEPPVAYPDYDTDTPKHYLWNENTKAWDEN